MKVKIDKTVDEAMDHDRQFEPVFYIRVMTSDGTEFDISEDQHTGALRIAVQRGTMVVLPQAANVIRLFEQRT